MIQGFDARTGKLRWAWDMMHPEWNGYPPAGQEWARGTPNMWTMASGDEQLGLVYLPMGNAAADYYSSLRRPEENQFATSLVALDVTTGKPRWRFQAVRKDVWDYDFGAQATLVEYKGVPAMVLPSKQGDIYILDRRTGRPLIPVGEIKAPQIGVEPQQRAATQPVSLWHTLRQPDLTERDMWGMSPIDQIVCRIQFRRASYKGFFTPPEADRHSIEYPGYNGGTDWGGIAVDPQRGVIVANYNDMLNYVRLVPRAEANQRGWQPRDQARGKIGGAEGAGDPQAHTPYAIDVNAGWQLPFTGMLCKQPPYGGIRAIDMATSKTIWDRPLGEARTNGPFGIPSMLPIPIGTPNNGGSVVTVGVLIFFIHHVPQRIHINSVIEDIGRRLQHEVDRRFPSVIGTADPDAAETEASDRLEPDGSPRAVGARGTGYIQLIDEDLLMRTATDSDLVCRIRYRPGDFVHEGRTLLELWPAERCDDACIGQLQGAFALGAQRTALQDLRFLIDELVETADRALSPGINDPFTAVTCMDWLGAARAVRATILVGDE
ncbi:DUF2254 family protein [Sphingomonas elodea]|uniref:DUF2254 family protein n=1 Tax=Sphingomonas elodea TaxID=179878 RepID=UPI000313E5E5|nr:DUF2254 family protein [Sphingomonas elodea]